MNLDDSNWPLVFASQFCGFFSFLSLLIFVTLHVSVEDHPLSGFN